MKALIIDDEPLARERIAQLLQSEPDVEIVGECGDGPSALRAIQDRNPDLIFLDIRMPGMDGFEMLESLAKGYAPAIIFATAYDSFAVRAFRLHAADYLLKPIDGERLYETLNHVRKRFDQPTGAWRECLLPLLHELNAHDARFRRIVLKCDGELICLKVADIEWVESARNHVAFHAGPSSHIVRETMNGVEERLREYNFARIHRGAIVNLGRIKRLKPLLYGDYSVELRDGTKLMLSRGHVQGVLERLGTDVFSAIGKR